MLKKTLQLPKLMKRNPLGFLPVIISMKIIQIIPNMGLCQLCILDQMKKSRC